MPHTPDFIVIATIEQRLAELAAAEAAEPEAELKRWTVITASCQPLAFDIDAAGNITNPRSSPPEKATRFNRATARLVGRRVFDGSGMPGKAVLVRHCYMVARCKLQRTLDDWRGRAWPRATKE